jgi:hypothetical protein
VVIWKDSRGLYSIRGVDSFGNVQVQKLSNKIAPKLDTIPADQRDGFVSAHIRTPTKRHYRFAYSDTASGLNNKMFIYDYDHMTPDPATGEPVGAFLPWTGYNVQVMAVIENAATGNDEIYIGDDTGHVFIMDANGNTDEDTAGNPKAITSLVRTKHFDAGSDHMTKRWRMLVVEGLASGSTVGLSWKTNFGHGVAGTEPLNLIAPAGGVAIWDTDFWDQSFYAGELKLVAVRKRLFKATGHHIQFDFGMTGIGATWKMHGFVLYTVMVPSVRVRKG